MNIINVNFQTDGQIVLTYTDGSTKNFVDASTIAPTPEPTPTPEIPKITVPVNTPIELVVG